MKKIESIWREILETGLKKPDFEQKELAVKFGFSTSTVFAAVSDLREIGAVDVSGRGFRLINFKKALLFWATHRNLQNDFIYKTRVEMPILEIEGLVDNKSIFGGYSAAKRLLDEAPVDYDKVYLYATDSSELEARFTKKHGAPNLFVLKADSFLAGFGKVTPVSQTYVDLWNFRDWFSEDYLRALEEKFYAGLLQ